jgi:hypothetical protein
MPSPFGFEFVLVPTLSQLPALLWCQGRATLEIMSLTPTCDVLFFPEEEHRASGEADVVPPVVRGDGKVDYSLTSRQLPAPDLQ